MKFEWNPFEFGDALGLTRGPLSGRAPGKLTDSGLDLQEQINPFISRKDLEHSNDIAPYVAAAIAGGSMFSNMGSGSAGEGFSGFSTPSWMKYARMGQMGQGLLNGALGGAGNGTGGVEQKRKGILGMSSTAPLFTLGGGDSDAMTLAGLASLGNYG